MLIPILFCSRIPLQCFQYFQNYSEYCLIILWKHAKNTQQGSSVPNNCVSLSYALHQQVYNLLLSSCYQPSIFSTNPDIVRGLPDSTVSGCIVLIYSASIMSTSKKVTCNLELQNCLIPAISRYEVRLMVLAMKHGRELCNASRSTVHDVGIQDDPI